MHKIFLLISFMVLGTILTAQRPIRRPNTDTEPERQAPAEPFEEGAEFKDKLWYGGSFVLSFGSFNNTSSFVAGLAPMVGYKITPDFSVGPRVEFLYNYYQIRDFATTYKFNLFSAGIGPFARYKFFNVIFAHAEYQLDFIQQPFFDANFNPIKVTATNSNFFAGVGYNAGGGEILVLYNFLANQNSLSRPISFRFGFTFRF